MGDVVRLTDLNWGPSLVGNLEKIREGSLIVILQTSHVYRDYLVLSPSGALVFIHLEQNSAVKVVL